MQTIESQTYHRMTGIASDLAGVSHSRVFSRERSKRTCHVRYACWHVLYSSGDYSMQEIADLSGYLDHSTISHGLLRASKLLETSPNFIRLVSELSKRFS